MFIHIIYEKNLKETFKYHLLIIEFNFVIAHSLWIKMLF
jgi:hypothetical protein